LTTIPRAKDGLHTKGQQSDYRLRDNKRTTNCRTTDGLSIKRQHNGMDYSLRDNILTEG